MLRCWPVRRWRSISPYVLVVPSIGWEGAATANRSSKAFTSNAVFRNKSSLMIDRDQATPSLTVTLLQKPQICEQTDFLTLECAVIHLSEPKWLRFKWVSDEPVCCSPRRAQRCDLLNSQTFTTKSDSLAEKPASHMFFIIKQRRFPKLDAHGEGVNNR